ncbi:hypothetical protein M885DRAFT_525448 [Pelagophyceae sp. CCMP2097]|nr:hypothetical protein M885DRAFT_525448 [Pelagophyceae sp. CCMP2097]
MQWETQRSAWLGRGAAGAAKRQLVDGRRVGGAAFAETLARECWRFADWRDLKICAACSKQILGASAAAVARIRGDVTRASSRLVVSVECGALAAGALEPFPGGFLYTTTIGLPAAYRHLLSDDGRGDVHATGLAVRWAGEQRGWGLATTLPLAQGARVIDYTGDLIRKRAAAVRERNSWTNAATAGTHVLSLVEHSADDSVAAWRTTVDATERGGAARFINHSCDPNLVLEALRRPGQLVPTLSFFSRRALAAGEELCFDYSGLADDAREPAVGPPVQGANVVTSSTKRCGCGALNCRIWLPAHREWTSRDADI